MQRLVDRGSLTSTLGAYLTGVAVTSAPWLLTTAVLMSLRLAARGRGTQEFLVVEQTVTIVYAVTVVLSAPVHVVVSRYAADRLYDQRLTAIAAPLRRALASTLIGFAVVGALLVAGLRVPSTIALPCVVLTVVVGAQWLMLSVGGGLSSPGVVLRAFGLGTPLSIMAALVLERAFGLGALGYLYGFGIGQLLTFVLLLGGIVRALPERADEDARLLPAFLEYRLLAISSFVYHLSIWADKLCVWVLAGRETAAVYTATAALAWFSVIPAFAWIYVQIETTFYQRFRAFYGSLEAGGTLAELRDRATLVRAEALRLMRGAAAVQACVALVGLAAAPVIVRVAALPPTAVVAFRLSLIGAALQVTALLELLLLYYLDLRRDALAVSLVLLLSELALTTASWCAGLPPSLGYAAACGIACALGLLLVRRRMATLLVDTFQSQPFGGL